MDKVSFQDAAKLAAVHFNTVKNWRKAGKLKTAEKVLENGRELWLVDPSEVIQIARQSRQNLPEIPDNQAVHIDGANIDNGRTDVYTTPLNVPSRGQDISTNPALEQNLTFFRESIVRPLVEANERQAARLEELAQEIGTLKERLRQVEAGQVAQETRPEIVDNKQPAAFEIPAQPGKKRGFWSRLFSG